MTDFQSANGSEAQFESHEADFELTPESLISVDYIPPPSGVSQYVTTLYHFRCDEPVIRDIQPASIGHLSLFPKGRGEMHFVGGRRDPNHAVAMLSPLSTATPIFVNGPMHVIGAALTPQGWAALTGLHAGENRDRMFEARDALGDDVQAMGEPLIAGYLSGKVSGRDCALQLGEYIEGKARKLNPRHVDLIRTTNQWLGASLNPELADLMAEAAYSERQVQRLVERYFGLPPQALARKYRALRAAALLSFPQLTPEYEAELADAFSDQSHMIREIQKFAGRTPARLRKDDNPFLAEMIDPKNFRELE